jgi:hypothetical protein
VVHGSDGAAEVCLRFPSRGAIWELRSMPATDWVAGKGSVRPGTGWLMRQLGFTAAQRRAWFDHGRKEYLAAAAVSSSVRQR